MRRPREAVDAAVLAAAVRVDRQVEARCRASRCSARIDLTRSSMICVAGREALLVRRLVERAPAVVEALARLARVAMLDRPDGAAPLDRRAHGVLGPRRFVARDRSLAFRGRRHTVNIYSNQEARQRVPLLLVLGQSPPLLAGRSRLRRACGRPVRTGPGCERRSPWPSAASWSADRRADRSRRRAATRSQRCDRRAFASSWRPATASRPRVRSPSGSPSTRCTANSVRPTSSPWSRSCSAKPAASHGRRRHQ